MRKAMKNTIFGTALVAMLLGAGTAANAQRPGFERGNEGRGNVARSFDHGYDRGYAREGYGGFAHPVGPAYPVGPRYGFGVSVGIPAAPVYDGYADGYIPPSPGDGYEWAAGYYNGGVWIPGTWRLRAGYVGARPYGYGRVAYGRGFDRPVARGFYGRR